MMLQRVALQEFQCTRCKGTIAPGCVFLAGTVKHGEAPHPPVAGATYIGVIEVRLCYECFAEE